MAIRHRSVAVALPAGSRSARWPSARARETLAGIGLLTPTVLLLVGLVLYPFFYAIWLAFSDKTVGSPGHFVGLKVQVIPGIVDTRTIITFKAF